MDRKATTATRTFTDAQAALSHAAALYDDGIRRLRKALQAFISGRQFHSRVREVYPFVRVRTDTVARSDSRLSYGFVAGPGPLRDHADAARPVRRLLPRAVPPAAAKPRRRARSRHQHAADPGALLVRRARPHRRHAERRAAPADARPVRPARPGAMDDGIANGTLRAARRARRSRWRCSPRRASTTRCTACATTPAPRPSTSRTSCCSPTTSSTSTSSCASATR